MKKAGKLFGLLVLGTALVFTSCKKDEAYSEGGSIEEQAVALGTTVVLKNGSVNTDATIAGSYEKVIVEPLVKSETCKEIVAGVVEFRLNDEVIATIDFGNGDCDGVATKVCNGESYTFKLCDDKWEAKKKFMWKKGLKKGKKDYEYTKVVTNPIVKTDDCDYIVEGTVEFYKEDTWIATVDFGDGTCDDIATKTTEKGTNSFSMLHFIKQ